MNKEFIKEVKDNVNIVDVVAQYLPLQKRGRNYMGVCPFHDDHRPSLCVNENTQTFRCFVCGEHGDVIAFVEKAEGISFTEAVKKVAAFSGIEIPHGMMPKASPESLERKRLYKAMEEAQELYGYLIHSTAGVQADAYIEKVRGFDDATVRRFGIGYAPGGARLKLLLKNCGFSPLEMQKTGLILEDGRDRFSDRITFPLCDPHGRIVGFSGRIYRNENGGAPKYMNSPQGEIFEKGKILYNYHRAAPAARKAGRIFLCEGFMDVIAMSRAGIDESVALMGTALTDEHMRLLKNASSEVTVCLDGDKAGKKAASKTVLSLLKKGFNVSVVLLPEGHDPDEIFRSGGKEALLSELKKELAPAEFLIGCLKADTFSEKQECVKRIRKLVPLLCRTPEEKTLCAELLAEKTGFDKDDVRESLFEKTEVRIRMNEIGTAYAALQNALHTYRPTEEKILAAMAVSENITNIYSEKIGVLFTPGFSEIAQNIIEARKKGKNIPALPAEVSQPAPGRAELKILLKTAMKNAEAMHYGKRN